MFEAWSPRPAHLQPAASTHSRWAAPISMALTLTGPQEAVLKGPPSRAASTSQPQPPHSTQDLLAPPLTAAQPKPAPILTRSYGPVQTTQPLITPSRPGCSAEVVCTPTAQTLPHRDLQACASFRTGPHPEQSLVEEFVLVPGSQGAEGSCMTCQRINQGITIVSPPSVHGPPRPKPEPELHVKQEEPWDEPMLGFCEAPLPQPDQAASGVLAMDAEAGWHNPAMQRSASLQTRSKRSCSRAQGLCKRSKSTAPDGDIVSTYSQAQQRQEQQQRQQQDQPRGAGSHQQQWVQPGRPQEQRQQPHQAAPLHRGPAPGPGHFPNPMVPSGSAGPGAMVHVSPELAWLLPSTSVPGMVRAGWILLGCCDGCLTLELNEACMLPACQGSASPKDACSIACLCRILCSNGCMLHHACIASQKPPGLSHVW